MDQRTKTALRKLVEIIRFSSTDTSDECDTQNDYHVHGGMDPSDCCELEELMKYIDES
jgi:hypothetical protein